MHHLYFVVNFLQVVGDEDVKCVNCVVIMLTIKGIYKDVFSYSSGIFLRAFFVVHGLLGVTLRDGDMKQHLCLGKIHRLDLALVPTTVVFQVIVYTASVTKGMIFS